MPGDAGVARARRLFPRLQLSPRAVCDLELLATGAFSPLRGFMGRADYERVLGEMRLADGALFPLPVTLPVGPDAGLALDAEVALADQHNNLLALMRVEEIYEWDRAREARTAYGTNDSRHPLVAEMNSWGGLYVSGSLRVVQLPLYYDFRHLRLSPAEVRAKLSASDTGKSSPFQTRNPLHRAHEELTARAARPWTARCSCTRSSAYQAGDIDHFTRVRSYKVLASVTTIRRA